MTPDQASLQGFFVNGPWDVSLHRHAKEKAGKNAKVQQVFNDIEERVHPFGEKITADN